MSPGRKKNLVSRVCAMIEDGFGVDDIMQETDIDCADLVCVLEGAVRAGKAVEPWLRLAKQRAKNEARHSPPL